jgi:hypothetical protein
VHYSFDEDIVSTVKNSGSFGPSYDATQHNVLSSVSGAIGNAAWFDDAQQSIVTSPSIATIERQQPRTISVWIRTSSKSPEAYIYPSGKFSSPQSGFRLSVADGIIRLQIDAKTQLEANQGNVKLNDDAWHHVAVTFRRSVKDEVVFYIDGQNYGLKNTVASTIYTNANTDDINIGGRKEGASIEGWTGFLDDFAIWASALSSPMLSAVKTCGEALAYNANDMEALFKIFRKKTGSVKIKGLIWGYSVALSGSLGSCEAQNIVGHYSLKLNEVGQGLATF